jgi:hypothetical protein
MLYVVSGASNDARQAVSTGAVDIGNTSGSSVSQLNGTNHAGLRFAGVNLPNSQAILSATLTFPELSNLGGSGAMTHTTVYAEAADNSTTFTTATNNVSSRSRTTASGSLGVAPSATSNFQVEVTTQVQQVLNRTGWASGNALSLLLIASGTSSANFIDPYRQNMYPPTLTIVTAGGFTTTLKVNQGKDDGFEVISSNATNNSGTSITLNGLNAAGFRFRTSNIQRKQAISKAILRFPTVTAATGSGTLDKVIIQGGADMYGSSSPYNDAGFGITGVQYLAKTFAAVDGAKVAATTTQFTTGIDVTAIVQEILDTITNPGGSTYNPASTDFIITIQGDGTSGGNSVTVGTYDGSPGAGAELLITMANDAIGTATTATQDSTGDASFIIGTSPLTLSVTNNAAGGWMTGYVTAKTLGLSVPNGAVINGIDVSFDTNGYSAFTSNVQLVDAGGVVGYDHSYQPLGQNFGSKTTRFFGGATDTWGRTWTSSDVNNAGFGVKIKVRNTTGGGGVAVISNIKVTVHYNNDNLGFYQVAQSYKSLPEFYANGVYTSSGNEAYGQAFGVLRITNTTGRILKLTKIGVPLKAVYAVVTSGGGGKGDEGSSTTYDRSSNPAEIKIWNGVSTTVTGGTLVKTFARRRTKGPSYSEYELPLDSVMTVPIGGTIAVTFNIHGVSGVNEPSFISYLGQYAATDSSQKFFRGFNEDASDGGNGAPGIDPSSLVYSLYETVPPAGATIEGGAEMTAAGYDVQFGSATMAGDSEISVTGYAVGKGSALIEGDSKMYADRITMTGGSNMTVTGTINPLAVTKTYQYKVYDQAWNFLGIWDDVVSNFGYSQEINNAGAAINVTLARNSDTGTAAYDVLANDSGDPIIGDDGSTIAAETETLNAIGPGTNVDLNLNVKIYEFSSNTLDVAGDLVFTGYISMYTSQYGTTENTVVSIFSYGADLDNYILMDGNNTRVPYLSQDPSAILTNALSKFNTDGGIISYFKDANPLTDDTVDDTGTIVTYTFNGNTLLEVIKKCLELAPTDWFFYPDLATNLLYFKPRPSSPKHYFYLGKHVLNLSLEKTMEGITNDVLFTGGKPTSLSIDRFNDVAGTALTSHSGELQSVWTKHPSSATGTGFVITNANRVRPSAAGEQLYIVNQDAGSSDYQLDVDYWVPAAGAANGDFGIAGRVDPSTFNYYLARIWNDSTVQLYKCINGTYTLLQQGTLKTALAPGQTRHMTVKFEGAQITVYVDNTAYVDIEDRSIIFGSRYGIRSGTAPATDTASGFHMDNFNVSLLNNDNATQVYKRYVDSTSIATYRRGVERVSDNRVTLESSADVIVSSMINRAKNPRYRSNITISGSTYDIRSIKLGDLVGFRNFGNYVDDVTMQVVRIDYTPDAVQLQLDTLLPSVPKRLEDIKRNLNQEQVSDNPDAPDV